MDLKFSSISFLFSFSLFLIVLVRVIESFRRARNSSFYRIPSPQQLPIIGNLHQLAGSLPHRAFRDLSETYGPIMRLKLGEHSTVVVSSPELARQVFREHDIIFATRPYTLYAEIMSYKSTNIAFAPYGDYWRQIRKICIMELLSNKRVRGFEPTRSIETEALLDRVASRAGTVINLTEDIYSTTYSITSRAAFGSKGKGHLEFIAMMKEAIRLAAGFSITDLYPSISFLDLIQGMKRKLENLHAQTDKVLEEIIAEHKGDCNFKFDQNKGDNCCDEEEVEDLVDVLLKLQKDDTQELRLTTDNIKAILQDMFTAGSDTAATTLDWTMSELIKNPNVMKRAQEEVRSVFDGKGRIDEVDFQKLHYMKSVIKETLRLHPPAPILLPRECQERCEIGGYEIPEKTRVIVNAWAMARDPKLWEEPESYKPERFIDSQVDFRGTSFEYIPFGSGRRICPGTSYGVANIEHVLAKLLYHFNWELPEGMKNKELDMSEHFGVTIRRRDDLRIIPLVYSPNNK